MYDDFSHYTYPLTIALKWLLFVNNILPTKHKNDATLDNISSKLNLIWTDVYLGTFCILHIYVN